MIIRTHHPSGVRRIVEVIGRVPAHYRHPMHGCGFWRVSGAEWRELNGIRGIHRSHALLCDLRAVEPKHTGESEHVTMVE